MLLKGYYSTTPHSSPCWEANSRSVRQEIASFYTTQRFTTVFTRASQRPIFCAKWIQSTPYFPKVYLNIILPFTPRSSKLFLPFRLFNENVAFLNPPRVLRDQPTILDLNFIIKYIIVYFTINLFNILIKYKYISCLWDFVELSVYKRICSFIVSDID